MVAVLSLRLLVLDQQALSCAQALSPLQKGLRIFPSGRGVCHPLSLLTGSPCASLGTPLGGPLAARTTDAQRVPAAALSIASVGRRREVHF